MVDRETGRAVVTGVGVVCPIGIGNADYWNSLTTGRSGISACAELGNTPMPVRFGGYIHDFDAKRYVTPRKSLKVMCREIQLGFAAAGLAIDEAGVTPNTIEPDRFGVVFGSDMLYGELDELEDLYRSCMTAHGFDFSRWGKSMSQLNPLWLLKYLPNMVACHIGIAHDARGHNNTITLGDASSLLAITEAVRVIERGHADLMICGGTGSRLSLTAMMYRGDSQLSHRNESPAEASRPFDLNRDGIVNGEGAAAFVVERKSHALARGATILAEIIGCGCGHEIRANGQPETGAASKQAVCRAMEDACTPVNEIDHVNARGLSTLAGDVAEARAIRDTMGDLPVIAPKSYFGHLGAGSGAVEAVASVLALVHGVVPPTLNYRAADPDCPVNVLREPKELRASTVALLNQSGTGQAAAVLVRRA
jgi:3-oxoacyl-[acyl-carrier-protein] synthase II